MKLIDLVEKAGLIDDFDIQDRFRNLSVKGLESDSRKIGAGYIFCAIPGEKRDGREYISTALDNGAVAVLLPDDTDTDQYADRHDIAFVMSASPRQDLCKLAAAFFDRQPETIVAVTGTNGKSSVVNFIRQIWSAYGYNAASLGTIGLQKGNVLRPGSLTTPDPVQLHKDLDEAAREGVTHLAIEASSHGLHQYRLDGVMISAAAFTNLTHEHLDYHKTYENYRAAKGRLFSDLLPQGKEAVLNADSKEFSYYQKICSDRGQTVLSFGHQGKDLKILERNPHPQGQNVSVEAFGTTYQLDLPLVGEFQLMNVLCAAGLCLSQMPDREDAVKDIFEICQSLQPVRGRMELISGHPENAAIYIDYAHTPDALETVLKSLRPHTENNLVCVFGCGGDRDRNKRPMMGKIASHLADKVIITDDNPRTEDPAVIRRAIMDAAGDAQEIGSRQEAIEQAVMSLQKGDVLLIAGKGHEQGQIIGEEVFPFDDVEKTRDALSKFYNNGDQVK